VICNADATLPDTFSNDDPDDLAVSGDDACLDRGAGDTVSWVMTTGVQGEHPPGGHITRHPDPRLG